MDYEIFSSNNSILQSSAIHPKIATADLISRFEGEGITSAFRNIKCNFRTHGPKNLNPIENSRWKDQNRGLVFWDGTEISLQVQ